MLLPKEKGHWKYNANNDQYKKNTWQKKSRVNGKSESERRKINQNTRYKKIISWTLNPVGILPIKLNMWWTEEII